MTLVIWSSGVQLGFQLRELAALEQLVKLVERVWEDAVDSSPPPREYLRPTSVLCVVVVGWPASAPILSSIVPPSSLSKVYCRAHVDRGPLDVR
jgi:hypothetical protein